MPKADLSYLLKYLAMSRSRYLCGLDKTADDRLDWSVGGEAGSPLALAGRTVQFLSFVAYLFEHKAMPESRPELVSPADREAAKAAVSEAFDRLIASVRGLSDEDLQAMVPTPWRQPAPLEAMLWWLPNVIGYGQGQLNLAQLAYGDTNPNVPPDWGSEEP